MQFELDPFSPNGFRKKPADNFRPYFAGGPGKPSLLDSVNGKHGAVEIIGGTNVTIDNSGKEIVISASGGGGGVSDWGDIGGTLSDQTDLQAALDAKVTGPATATDNAIARFDSTTGELIQNSGIIIDDDNNLTTAAGYLRGLNVDAYGANAQFRLTNTNDSSTAHGFWKVTYFGSEIGYSNTSGDDFDSILYIGKMSGSGDTVIASAGKTDILGLGDLRNILDDGSGNMSVGSGGIFRTYNTADVATNYERLSMTWATNVMQIFSQSGGTGTLRNIQIGEPTTYLEFAHLSSAGAPKYTFNRSATTSGSLLRITSSGLTGAAGQTQYGLRIDPTVNQTSTATFYGLDVNPTITAVGSGGGFLAAFRTGGTTQATIATNGATVFNENGNDADFRIEGDTDANLVFVDASADRVGIGNTTPGTKLNIGSAFTDNGSASAAALSIRFDAQSGNFPIGLYIQDSGSSGALGGAGMVMGSNDGAAMGTGERLGFFLFAGGTGSAFANQAGITAFTSEAWGSGRGTELRFEITGNGGTGRATALTLRNDKSALFAGAVLETVVALSDGANIATNAALGNVFTVTLGGNRTMDNPTNAVSGQKIIYRIKQDGTGSRTITWGSNFRFSGGTAPTLTTAANKTDYVAFVYNAADTKWDNVAYIGNF